MEVKNNEQADLPKNSKKHGASIGEVRQDIQNAIDFAYTDPNSSVINIKAQNAVPRKNGIPTPDELICHIANEVHRRQT